MPRALIAETIDVIAMLVGCGADRRLSEVAQVRDRTTTGDYDAPQERPQNGFWTTAQWAL